MGTHTCPVCQEPSARLISSASEGAVVDYWRCSDCRHVWTTKKNDTDVLRHVTTPKRPVKAVADVYLRPKPDRRRAS